MSEEAREIPSPVSFEEDLTDLDFRPQPVEPEYPEPEDPKGFTAPASVESSAFLTDGLPEQIPIPDNVSPKEPNQETADQEALVAAERDSTPPRESESSTQDGSPKTRGGKLKQPAVVEVPPLPDSLTPGSQSEDKLT